MENDSKKEIQRLKRQLSAMNRKQEDVPTDVPIELLDFVPTEPEMPPVEEAADLSGEMEEAILRGREETAKLLRRENRWLVGLMIFASCLCVGIIAVLIYWLEVFLK